MIDIQTTLERSCGTRGIGVYHVGISTTYEILHRTEIPAGALSHKRHGGVARNSRSDDVLPFIQVIHIEYNPLASQLEADRIVT